MVHLPSAGTSIPTQDPERERMKRAADTMSVRISRRHRWQAQRSTMMTKRISISLAAFAVASLFIADIAPAVAQQAAPSRTPSSTVPGGPNGGGGSGDGGMRSIGCGEFGYANMPGSCISQAMSCICPNDSDPNYRAPSSCEGIHRNVRRAAERQCAIHRSAMRQVD
ncbi:hypothetical protein [Kaistia terrae]|uniref:Uncharacterized protein n=1 Tax=Kaistia terrae TaxID=537017 RepID=A0ABW0PVF6_9HYPH|nr:hypothetical protein [Kaistia terrae]MCX5576666.1 hypothetical protein [Kaistia terrae]